MKPQLSVVAVLALLTNPVTTIADDADPNVAAPPTPNPAFANTTPSPRRWTLWAHGAYRAASDSFVSTETTGGTILGGADVFHGPGAAFSAEAEWFDPKGYSSLAIVAEHTNIRDETPNSRSSSTLVSGLFLGRFRTKSTPSLWLGGGFGVAVVTLGSTVSHTFSDGSRLNLERSSSSLISKLQAGADFTIGEGFNLGVIGAYSRLAPIWRGSILTEDGAGNFKITYHASFWTLGIRFGVDL